MTQLALKFAHEFSQEELFMRTWHLRIFDEPILLTSDAPIAMRSAGPPGTPVPGIRTADAIYWPLDRQHLLAFERTESADGTRVTEHVPPGRAIKANALVASGAERWIVHHPDDDPLRGLVIPERPEMTKETQSLLLPDGSVMEATRHLRRKG